MEPEFRLKENGVSPEKLDDSSSQGSTAVLESSSSQDTPPVIRGPSLLDSYSPKKKPQARRKPLSSIMTANDELGNGKAQVSMTVELNTDEMNKHDSSDSFCDELRTIACGKLGKSLSSSLDLCVSQAVPCDSPEIETQDYNVGDKDNINNKVSDEGQHISADSSLNISGDKHVTSSFSTPDMPAQHHSTPHQSSERSDKKNVLVNSQDFSLAEQSFYFSHSSVIANKNEGSIHIQFIGEKRSDIKKFVSFLGSQAGIFLDNLIEKWSFQCPYSADISSSSKSKSSGSGNELLKAAISNSSRQGPNDANTPCLQLANSMSPEGSPLKQDQSTQVAFKATPKSARKRTKSGVRRSSKNARSLTVIDENKDDDNLRGAKRKLEGGSSSEPLQDAQNWKEVGGEKKKDDKIREGEESQSEGENEIGRRQQSSKVAIKVVMPSKKRQKAAESPWVIKEEKDAAESLGTKVANTDVSRISDEEFSAKADRSVQKVLLKSVELQSNLDVYSQYGRFYYPAKLGQHIKGDKWEVNFLDGIKLEVGHVRVIPVQYIPKGTPVYCECNMDIKLPGIIVGYKSNGEVDYIVQLDNGDVRIVPRMKVILSIDQMKLLLSEAPGIRTPCLDLDNVICGKRKRVQRMVLQSPSANRRAKKDMVLDGTENEVDREREATPRRSAKKLNMQDVDKPQVLSSFHDCVDTKQLKERKLAESEISTPKPIFEGYGFLLTKKEVLSDIDDDMSDTERTFIMVDFNKAELRRLIEDRGGVVFDDFMSSQLHPKLQILIISNRACRTEKFVYALAAGFPPVHNAWVTDSIRRDSILAYTQYLLPSAIFESEIIEWKPRGKTLNGKKILIASDDVNFVQFWCSVLVVAGACKVTHFDKSLAASPLDYDFIFGKMPEEQEESDKLLMNMLKNLLPRVPGVTNLWGIYCLANGLFELKHSESNFALW